MKSLKFVFFLGYLLLTGLALGSAKDIHQFIKNGDFQAVKNLLDKEISLLYTLDENKNTPLHQACISGNLDITQYLIKRGADINAQNHQENTPLHLAAEKNHFKIVKFLVEKGASPNLKNFRGHVPALNSLVERSETNIIRYLINHGTDPNTEDLYGSTLLSRACERRFPEIVDLLLEKKIKLPTQKNKIMRMIFLAVYIDHLRLFNLLLEKNPGIKLVERAESLLRWAAENGSVKLFKLFIKKKFNSMSPNIYKNKKGARQII